MKNYPSKNGSLLNRAVLVLNSSYAPMTITTSKRAICLFFLDKVDVIETYTDLIHSPSRILPLPSIVKLKNYINYNGKYKSIFKPFVFDFKSFISPPCDLIISLVIVNPNPLSPLSLLREGSKVKKGLKTSS